MSCGGRAASACREAGIVMSATVSTLMRHRDVSGVSGVGPVATVCEFSSGLTAVHWDSATPSVAVYTDVRHVLDLHGHEGASELVLYDNARLVAGYKQVCFWLTREMTPERLPLSVAPHPDWPDRLLVKLRPTSLSFWVALLDGSMHAATYEQVRGEIVTTWVHPSGDLWLECRETGTYEDLLAGHTYNAYPDNDPYDPRD